jgi:hypothetical protein
MDNSLRIQKKMTEVLSFGNFRSVKLFNRLRCFQVLVFVSAILFFNESAQSQISNNGYKFDGVDDVMLIPPIFEYAYADYEYTVELIVNKTSVANGKYTYLFSNNSSDNASNISLFMNDAGQIYCTVGSTTYAPSVSAAHLNDSVCNHIALVVKSKNKILYVNSVEVINHNQYFMPGPLSTDTISVGKIFNPSTSALNGTIKELRLWNVARSQAEILSHIDSVLVPSPHLIGYWRLDTITGQSAHDYSLYANDAILGRTSAIDTDDPVLNSVCEPCLLNPPIISPAGLSTICYGDSMQFSAAVQAGFTMQWYFNGLALSGEIFSSIYLKKSGVYYVIYTDSVNGCEFKSNVVELNVKLENALKLTGEHLIGHQMCVDGDIYAANNPLYTYKWYRDGVLFDSLAYYPRWTQDPGNYYCQIEYSGCRVNTDTLSVFRRELKITPTTTPYCTGGQSVNLIASVLTAPTTNYGRYEWRNNNVTIGGANGSSYSTPLDGSYSCVFIDTLVCKWPTSSTNNVDINSNYPPNLTFANLTDHIYYDDCGIVMPAICIIDTYGHFYNSGLWYSWEYAMRTPINNYYYPAVQTTEQGYYTVSVNTSCGFAHFLTGGNGIVIYRPVKSNIKIHYDDVVFRNDSLIANMDDYWSSYQWYRDSILIPGETTRALETNISGKYSCYVTNSCGGKFSEELNFQVGQTCDLISTPNGTNFCAGNSAVMYLKHNYLYSPATWEYSSTPNGPWIYKDFDFSYSTNVEGWYRCVLDTAISSSEFGHMKYYSYPVFISIDNTVPSQIPIISTSPFACPNAINEIKLVPIQDIAEYSWVLPSNVAFVGSSTDTTIHANFPLNFVGGYVYAAAKNACGVGPYSSKLFLKYSMPSQLSIIGVTSGVCDSSNHTYVSLNHTPGYTTNWITSNGINILNSPNLDSIIVKFASKFTWGSIAVNQSNWCHSSAYSVLNVSSAPSPVSSVLGPSIGCSGQTNVLYSSLPVQGATNYLWRVPKGSTILSGQGSDSILITMGYYPGDVSVKAVNSCGSSAYNGMYVSIPCKMGEETIEDILVEPNPFSGSVMLSLGESLIGSKLTIYDVSGKVVYDSFVNESTLRLGEDLIPGVYMLVISNSNIIETKRIIKI